jgi:hypothetical protein
MFVLCCHSTSIIVTCQEASIGILEKILLMQPYITQALTSTSCGQPRRKSFTIKALGLLQTPARILQDMRSV